MTHSTTPLSYVTTTIKIDENAYIIFLQIFTSDPSSFHHKLCTFKLACIWRQVEYVFVATCTCVELYYMCTTCSATYSHSMWTLARRVNFRKGCLPNPSQPNPGHATEVFVCGLIQCYATFSSVLFTYNMHTNITHGVLLHTKNNEQGPENSLRLCMLYVKITLENVA